MKWAHFPLPRENRIAIITKGGGCGVIAADACRQKNMLLAFLSARSVNALNKLLPVYWSHSNPVDLAATLNPEAFSGCLEILIKDSDVDGIIALGVESGDRVKDLENKLLKMKLLKGIDLKQKRIGFKDILLAMELMELYKKPIIMASGLSSNVKRVSQQGKETVLFPTPQRAVEAMAVLCNYASFL